MNIEIILCLSDIRYLAWVLDDLIVEFRGELRVLENGIGERAEFKGVCHCDHRGCQRVAIDCEDQLVPSDSLI